MHGLSHLLAWREIAADSDVEAKVEVVNLGVSHAIIVAHLLAWCPRTHAAAAS